MKKIKLSGKYAVGENSYALVDDEMYEYLSQFSWYAVKDRRNFYAERKSGKRPNRKNIRMHREVLPNVNMVDHKDRNGLNNQASNLREGTFQGNAANIRLPKRNKWGYKGVNPSENGKWKAQIRINGKQTYLGTFETMIDAALAYDNAAVESFGEFANTNF